MVRKRILSVLSSCDDEGVWQQCEGVSSQLPASAFDARICLLSGSADEESLLRQNGGGVCLARRDRAADGWCVWPLFRQLRKFKPDVVHLWGTNALRYGLPISRLCGIETIFLSVFDAKPVAALWGFGLDRTLSRSLTKVIVPSLSIGQLAGFGSWITQDQWAVVPPAIEMANRVPISRTALLKQLRLPDHCRLIVTTDSLQFGSRVRDAIWATELLKVAGHKVQVLICGNGPQRQGIENFCRRLHLEDQIQVVTDHRLIAASLHHMDLFWNVSGVSGIVPMLYAMRGGIPVIAANTPALRSYIQDRQTGFMVPLGDRAALASTTHDLLNHFKQAEKVGVAAQASIETDFDPQATLQKYISLYRADVDRHSPSCTNTPDP